MPTESFSHSRIKVALFGATGTMGKEALKELVRRQNEFDIILLVRPSEKNIIFMKPYRRKAGLRGPGPGAGNKYVEEGRGLKIVWGDATDYADVVETVKGSDAVLDAMAFISPQADYYPDTARAVNIEGIRNIVRAIEEEQSGAERIRLVYTGTVAETGCRLGSIHHGRPGDPLKPSIYDYYAVTKISGERTVMESSLLHWVSLRMSFIMPVEWKDIAALSDPIMFHMPMSAAMENITARDAGFGMVNALDVPEESSFWNRAWNMGGGEKMRISAYDYQTVSLSNSGLSSIENVTERNWYALQNFHMQYFDDSAELETHLHYQRDSHETWAADVQRRQPLSMKAVRKLCEKSEKFRRRVETSVKERFRIMAETHRNGTVYWYRNGNEQRLKAFYGGREAYEAIPDWEKNRELLEKPFSESPALKHGYDEKKPVLEYSDLADAARFRGGELLSRDWNGNLMTKLEWKCGRGHSFAMKPNTVLKGGHWCPECVPPDWRYDEEARINPFFAQVWYNNHEKGKDEVFTEEELQDIAAADRD